MSRRWKVVQSVAAVLVMLAIAGNSFALPREGREQERSRDSQTVNIIKRIVRALGDGLTIPRP